MYKNITNLSFNFKTEPHIDKRSTSAAYTDEMNKDIASKSYMVIDDAEFNISFLFKNKYQINLFDTIPFGFCYNMANIPFFAQPITYDKDSPYVRDASLIHDYLLDNKEALYEMWNLKAYGLDRRDFRILTSDIFEIGLLQAGVPPKKARLMRNSVDLYQKFICWSWFKVK